MSDLLAFFIGFSAAGVGTLIGFAIGVTLVRRFS